MGKIKIVYTEGQLSASVNCKYEKLFVQKNISTNFFN